MWDVEDFLVLHLSISCDPDENCLGETVLMWPLNILV